MLLLFELKPLSNSIFLFPSPIGEGARRANEVERGCGEVSYSTLTIANTLYALLFRE